METIEVEVRVAAPPEVVFSYFTDPEKYRRWMGLSAELDPRPDGRYRVRVRRASTTAGRFVAIEPPRRVVFTWGWEGDPQVPPGSSTVEVRLVPDGNGTLVRLRHEGLPTAESRDLHDGGWRHYLGRLATAGTGADPGPDPLAG